jgi:AAA family ATP:ADP antiporter
MANEQASRLDRFLRPFSDVRPGEGVTAVLLSLNVFLILTAYYVLKPVREALILGEGSPELKSYMSAGRSSCSLSSCLSTDGWPAGFPVAV